MILIVDNEPEIRRPVGSYMENKDLQDTEATSGHQPFILENSLGSQLHVQGVGYRFLGVVL